MSALLAACQTAPSIASETAALKAQLDAITAPVYAALDALHTPDTDKMAADVQAAIDQHDTVFQSGPVDSYDAARRDAGLKPNNRTLRDAHVELATYGFCPLGGKLYAVNNKLRLGHNNSATGVGTGDADFIELSQLLGYDYRDPVITNSVRYYVVDSTKNRSCTGTYNNGGTVDQLRDLLKAFNGDLPSMTAFLDASYPTGYGVVWSMPIITFIYRPAPTDPTYPAIFDAEYVRSKLSAPAFDYDITITGDTAIVVQEVFVLANATQELAVLQAKHLAATLLVKTAPLYCRVVRFSESDDVRSQAVVLATKNCKPHSLGPKAYRLGINVDGVARVVDVTGDRGTKFFTDAYTVNSIAAAINQVFAPLLACEGRGSEVLMSTLSRGTSSSISFFHTGDLDAAHLLGINDMVAASMSKTGDYAFDIAVQGGITWSGGAAPADNLPAGFVSAMRRFQVPTDAVTGMLTGESYWVAGSARVATIVDQMKAVTSNPKPRAIGTRISEITGLTKTYLEAAGFTDLVNLSYRDAKLILTGIKHVDELLVQRPEIDSLDIYVPDYQVDSALSVLLQSHIDSNGLVVPDTTMKTVSMFHQNKGKAAYLATMFFQLEDNLGLYTSDEQEILWSSLVGYIPSLYWGVQDIYEKNSPDTALSGTQPTSTSDTWADIINMVTDLVTDPETLLKSGLSAIVDFVCKQDPVACREIRNLMSQAGDMVGTAEEKIAAFLNWTANLLTSPLSATLFLLAKAVVLINTLLDAAIKLVTIVQSKMKSAVQGAFNTKKSLPEVLDSLANLTTSVYDNFGFQTKFLSCYVSGSGSIALSVAFSNMLGVVNLYVTAINALIDALLKVANHAIDLFQCLADKLTSQFSGSLSYESAGAGAYKAAGMFAIPVSYKLQCTVTYGYDNMSPELAHELSKMKSKLNTLMNMLKLHTITVNKQADTIKIFKGLEITAATSAGLLIQQLQDAIKAKLLSALSC